MNGLTVGCTVYPNINPPNVLVYILQMESYDVFFFFRSTINISKLFMMIQRLTHKTSRMFNVGMFTWKVVG